MIHYHILTVINIVNKNLFSIFKDIIISAINKKQILNNK